MTKDEILNMPAGREMDALVAEWVMKLNVVSRNHPCGYEPECGYYEASHFFPVIGSWFTEEGPVYLPENGIYPPIPEPEPRAYDDGLYCYVEPVLFYSSKISHVWEVVEEMRKRGHMLIFSSDKFGYRVEFLSDKAYPLMIARAENAPIAICQAALLYILEEKQNE
jgi:hypothetical protein